MDVETVNIGPNELMREMQEAQEAPSLGGLGGAASSSAAGAAPPAAAVAVPPPAPPNPPAIAPAPLLGPRSHVDTLKARLRELREPIYGTKQQLWVRLQKAETKVLADKEEMRILAEQQALRAEGGLTRSRGDSSRTGVAVEGRAGLAHADALPSSGLVQSLYTWTSIGEPSPTGSRREESTDPIGTDGLGLHRRRQRRPQRHRPFAGVADRGG